MRALVELLVDVLRGRPDCDHADSFVQVLDSLEEIRSAARDVGLDTLGELERIRRVGKHFVDVADLLVERGA